VENKPKVACAHPNPRPSLPADHSPLSSGEMRGQFTKLVGGSELSERLVWAVTNSSTPADLQATADKLVKLINNVSACPLALWLQR
jgi:hypothetical protein